MNIITGSGEPKLPNLNPKIIAWIDDLHGNVDPLVYAGRLSLPAPRNRIHAPSEMLAIDHFILESFLSAGWKAERVTYHYENVPVYKDFSDWGFFFYPIARRTPGRR